MEQVPRNEGQIAEELNILRVEAGGRDLLTYVKCIRFGLDLKIKYPDYKKYRLFHILSGSTPPEYVDKFDFPGDDSVENFIRSL